MTQTARTGTRQKRYTSQSLSDGTHTFNYQNVENEPTFSQTYVRRSLTRSLINT